MARENQKTIYAIVAVALFAALVFVGSVIQVPVPAAFGMTRIHLGNIFCLLSGFMLGPVSGGLAAGIGSGLYDIIIYGDMLSAPFTLVFKGLLAGVCGLIAYAGRAAAKKFSRNLIACITAAVVSSLFYMCKGIVELMIGGSAFVPAFIANIPKLLTSPPNTIIAVVVAMALYPALRKALDSTNFSQHISHHAGQ